MRRGLSGYAIVALGCVAIWALGLFWAWYDYTYPRTHVWVIELWPILVMLAMAAAVPIFLVCCIVLAVRSARAKS